jgi:OmpA-OmpF porin, OOP family
MILLLAALLQAASAQPASAITCADGATAASAAADCPRYVFFDSGKAELSRDAATELDRVAAFFREVGNARIVLSGFSDRSGPASANLRVSRERADLVRTGLVERGVSRDLISVAAFGETRPQIETADGVREPQNRRVEIRFSPR